MKKQIKKDTSDPYESIYKSVLKFLDPLTAEETYKQVVDEAIKLAGAVDGSIFIMDGGKLQRMYASSPHLYKRAISKNGYTYKAFRGKKLAILSEQKIDKATEPKIKHIAFVPLINRNQPIGVLSIYFSRKIKNICSEISILKTFSTIAALAIRKTQLYREIKNALDARDLFISIASHELKTPLTSIRIYSQLLHKKFSKSEKPETKWTNKIEMELGRLIMLINEFLSVENIKSGQLQYTLSQCSFKKIVQTAVDEFKKINTRTVILEDELIESDEIVGDSHKLHQVISNLLDNANKFSPPGKPIHINVKSNHKTLNISIKDEGKGISKKEIPRIFERYYKEDALATNGMGLGLFLTKNIIEYHKGEIKVHSSPNKGTTVNVKLPKSVNFNIFDF